jgi:peptide-methionine (S)-S-oxide reductase
MKIRFHDPHAPHQVSATEALPGRSEATPIPESHFVLGTPLAGPYPDSMQVTHLAMGCFWGAEKLFWQLRGVFSTAVGYCAGHTPNPTYQEVCSGRTGHTEAVRVVFDPDILPFPTLLRTFWEGHDPTQGMRQGNDHGTQYRSGIYPGSAELRTVTDESLRTYQAELQAAGFGKITTEIEKSTTFYFAEEYHQQYLAKNPAGYCGIGGTGVACPSGLGG